MSFVYDLKSAIGGARARTMRLIDIERWGRDMCDCRPTKALVDRIVDVLRIVASTDICVLGSCGGEDWRKEYPALTLVDVNKEESASNSLAYKSCTAKCIIQVEIANSGESLMGPSWFFRLCDATAKSVGESASPLYNALRVGKRKVGRATMYVADESHGGVKRTLETLSIIGLVGDVKELTAKQQERLGFSGYAFKEGLLWPHIITIQR